MMALKVHSLKGFSKVMAPEMKDLKACVWATY